MTQKHNQLAPPTRDGDDLDRLAEQMELRIRYSIPKTKVRAVVLYKLIQMRDETRSHWEEVRVPAESLVVVLVLLVAISSTPLALLPIPVDLEQVYALREKLWRCLQLSTLHNESFLRSTSNMRPKNKRFARRERNAPTLRYPI